ncbi:MAG TPA: hypothetical protein PLC89_27500 [Haliscomenobacter sp.]|jgi:hypothetical protein|uniref:Uncharacterized protein n=1 Tax=Haliscomenobacter hydrossis (strain ATCC 27775 / DSM 1100 / LMG 10767 / O) TaxID=760192 RepID=F4KQ88_HALH1|nr:MULTISPECIES: hypothetical protein [Haliscomenobacter]AEE48914.1 hypothetical protein Halhy_1015 [Haliscomenobacter hydrossis DSM 1100]HOY21089.1 hypothetical protein [Haliscomenobacter sp.]
MENIKIYDEVATFLAQSAPVQILAYRPSEATQHRFDDLVWKKKEQTLSAEEASELEHYFMLEHIFRLVKIRAAIQMAQ